jgi:hypothetical protein
VGGLLNVTSILASLLKKMSQKWWQM